MSCYHPADPKAWTGRNASAPLYVHQNVEAIDLETLGDRQLSGLCVLGYACEEGVRRNQGRVGAVQGPQAFRNALGKLPWHPPYGQQDKLWDIGDLHCEAQDLEAVQAALGQTLTRVLARGGFPLVIGGGHDIGWGHYLGLRAHLGDKARIGIINFDAHFDLRTPDPLPSSGTPFFQVAQSCQALGLPFDYLCLGVRKDANDASLYATAKQQGAEWIDLQDPRLQSPNALDSVLQAFCEPIDALYLTVCLDVFSSAYAPGVSAASPRGLSAEQGIALIDRVLAQPKLISCDIAELAPPLDRDHQCAKLAASIAHRVLESRR